MSPKDLELTFIHRRCASLKIDDRLPLWLPSGCLPIPRVGQGRRTLTPRHRAVLLPRPHRARERTRSILSYVGAYEFLIWRHSGRSERTAQPLVAAHRTASASIPFQLDENCVSVYKFPASRERTCPHRSSVLCWGLKRTRTVVTAVQLREGGDRSCELGVQPRD